MFKTLTRIRNAVPTGGSSTVLLSGIIYVSLNQKTATPKFVEVVYDEELGRTAMYIYKNRDKKRADAAIGLREAKVLINHDSPNTIGMINRESRTFILELDKDKEELPRFLAQWRSILMVSQNPNDMFSVITVSGADRGCVILITVSDNQPEISFKYLSGKQTNLELKHSEFLKVEHLSAFEVSVELKTHDLFHFISKRPNQLVRKLKEKLVQDFGMPDLGPLPETTGLNSSILYESKQGYLKTEPQAPREVVEAPDYISFRKRGDPPCRGLPPPPAPVEDYTPMEPNLSTIDPVQDDYLAMDQVQQMRLPQDDYLNMNQLKAGLQDDYLAMSDIHEKAKEDPLIADYLTMDDINDGFPASFAEDEDNEEEEDIYFDPTLHYPSSSSATRPVPPPPPPPPIVVGPIVAARPAPPPPLFPSRNQDQRNAHPPARLPITPAPVPFRKGSSSPLSSSDDRTDPENVLFMTHEEVHRVFKPRKTSLNVFDRPAPQKMNNYTSEVTVQPRPRQSRNFDDDNGSTDRKSRPISPMRVDKYTEVVLQPRPKIPIPTHEPLPSTEPSRHTDLTSPRRPVPLLPDPAVTVIRPSRHSIGTPYNTPVNKPVLPPKGENDVFRPRPQKKKKKKRPASTTGIGQTVIVPPIPPKSPTPSPRKMDLAPPVPRRN